VTVVGEPGVGKTRLVREFRATLDDERGPIVWREGRCLPYGDGITFWALGEIVKAHAAILESDTAEQAVGKLEAAVAELVDESPEREWLTSLLAPLVGVRVGGESGIEESTEMAFTGWRRFLESIAAPGSLMLVFEDLHWADPALLQFIEHLVDWSTGVPLFVVCTARPELYERAPGWGGGKRNSTTISLSPLSSDETSRLIGALLSDAVLPREVEAQLLERSGGNPLYAEEFVRMLTDRGILRRRDGAATIAADAEIQVPETVQALIAARLDTLAPERKALVHDAAVVGKVFWSGALSSMSGVDERAVREGLHELARKELVRPSRTSSVREQAEYSFWHILIRDVAYGQIPREARARKHLAAAAWSERISEGRVSDHAELLAYHYGHALDLTRAAGASDDAKQLEEPTRRFLVMAGDRALRLDVRVAAAYYQQALDLLPVGQERASVLAKAAEAAWLSGRFEEAEPRYRDAIAGFRDQKNVVRAGETMVRLSMALRDRGDTRQAQSLLSDAVALLEREPAGPERVLAYTHVARDHMFSGCYRESLEWAEKAIAVAEELGIEGHAMRALQSRGWCRCELGDLDGVDDLREALRIGLEFGLADETAVAYINLGNWLWQEEGPTSALETFREGIDFDSRRGLTFRAMWTRAESTWPLFDLGEWDELLHITDEVAGWERQHGGVQVGLRALPYKAAVLVHRGRLDEASSLQERFLPPARAIGDPDVLTPALAVSALIAHAAERPAAAIEFIEELEMGTRDHLLDRHLHVTDAMRISAAAGRLDLGQRFLEDAAFAARPRCSLLAARAGAVEGHGELELAAELYAEAASRWEEYGHVLERGYALLGAGRCLARLGRWAEASARLGEARAVFAALHAGALAAEAERWLEKAEV
jgi:tetratricopeptide (TPR) repeat protein